MKIDYTPTVFFLLAGLPLALYLLWRGWRNRAKPGAVPFVVLIALSTAWVVEAALELVSAELSTKLLWADLQYLSIVFVPVAWLALALDYTGRGALLTRRNLYLLCVVPVVMLGLQWSNSHHHLMRATVWLDTSGAHAVIGRTFGPAFWVHVAYSYILILAAMALLAHGVLSGPRLGRKQTAALLVGFAVPYVWNVAFLLRPGLLPMFDFTPAWFTIGELIVAYGLFRLRVFELVVVARDALLENMEDGLLVLDDADGVVDLNEAARALIGRPAGQILGAPLERSWSAWEQVAGAFQAGAERAVMSLGMNGERRDYEVKLSAFADDSRMHGRMLVIHDVTERSVLEENLRRQALTDGLTGLANRTLFMAKLTDTVHMARRHPEKLFAVMVLDLDRFKFINDTVGHPAGDAVLENVAIRLRRCVREADTVARLGGDEFLVLLTEVANSRDVVVVLERILDEMRAPLFVRQQQMIVSASVGVVLWDASYPDAEDLVHAADTAMYQAKQAGGACYRFFDERMHRALLESLEAEAELRAAVDEGSFELVYQPVIEVKTGNVVALEALVRWQHPQRGTVPPSAFMTVAENSGLIVPLGETILNRLCTQLSEWRLHASPAFDLPVSLNVSPRQLTETDFVGSILGRITDWRLPPGTLALEITEAALNRDPVRSRNAIKELGTLGMRVCLDDFGAGPSSLHHLTTFPGQEVKLDCTLIAKMTGAAAELTLVKAIIDLAHALTLTVTAVGVESQREWDLLSELRCDRVQGFYLGEPMSPAVLLEYLRERRTTAQPMQLLRGPTA